jgi:hypothetical protein
MRSALAILDFDEAEHEEGNSPFARRSHDFLLGDQLNAACGKLVAAQITAGVHEWYEQLVEKHRAEYTRFEKSFSFHLHALQISLESYQAEALNRELSELVAEWKKTKQRASSSVLKWVMHPAYQRIIGKGKDAVPFILRELEREPDHWFWALNAITGEDPVKEEDKGDIAAMSRAWIHWGRQSGYI